MLKLDTVHRDILQVISKAKQFQKVVTVNILGFWDAGFLRKLSKTLEEGREVKNPKRCVTTGTTAYNFDNYIYKSWKILNQAALLLVETNCGFRFC